MSPKWGERGLASVGAQSLFIKPIFSDAIRGTCSLQGPACSDVPMEGVFFLNSFSFGGYFFCFSCFCWILASRKCFKMKGNIQKKQVKHMEKPKQAKRKPNKDSKIPKLTPRPMFHGSLRSLKLTGLLLGRFATAMSHSLGWYWWRNFPSSGAETATGWVFWVFCFFLFGGLPTRMGSWGWSIGGIREVLFVPASIDGRESFYFLVAYLNLF